MDNFLLLLIIPLIRFLINIKNWFFVRRVLKKHDEFILGAFDGANDLEKKISTKAATWIRGRTSEITRVYSLTGREQPIETFMEGIGYSRVQQKKLNILENLLFLNEDVISSGRSCLEVAKGFFWTNAINSVNPLYWLEVIFFLPKAIVSASGVDTTNKLADIGLKISQILYWAIIVWAFIFKPELFSFLKENATT